MYVKRGRYHRDVLVSWRERRYFKLKLVKALVSADGGGADPSTCSSSSARHQRTRVSLRIPHRDQLLEGSVMVEIVLLPPIGVSQEVTQQQESHTTAISRKR